MNLFILDKIILNAILNITGETLFKLSLGGMMATYFVCGIKHQKKVKK